MAYPARQAFVQGFAANTSFVLDLTPYGLVEDDMVAFNRTP